MKLIRYREKYKYQFKRNLYYTYKRYKNNKIEYNSNIYLNILAEGNKEGDYTLFQFEERDIEIKRNDYIIDFPENLLYKIFNSLMIFWDKENFYCKIFNINNINEKIKNKKNVLFVLNKIDLLTNKQKQTKEIKDMIWISAKNKNAYELKNALVKSFIGIEEKINNPIFNERKVSELNKCISNIENCINGLKAKMSLDVVIVDLLEGLANIKSSLNEDYDTEDILNHIFSKFCLGK